LLSFILCFFIEGDEVKHGSHSGTEAVAVVIFDFGGGKVSGDVRDGFVFDKLFVPADKYFSHDVAIITEVLDLLFCTQIVKTITR
tara:strand:+ start:1301 stop:1555 length:255 start_codon:yes stop_codon:yes gene_type:complete